MRRAIAFLLVGLSLSGCATSGFVYYHDISTEKIMDYCVTTSDFNACLDGAVLIYDRMSTFPWKSKPRAHSLVEGS